MLFQMTPLALFWHHVVNLGEKLRKLGKHGYVLCSEYIESLWSVEQMALL